MFPFAVYLAWSSRVKTSSVLPLTKRGETDGGCVVMKQGVSVGGGWVVGWLGWILGWVGRFLQQLKPVRQIFHILWKRVVKDEFQTSKWLNKRVFSIVGWSKCEETLEESVVDTIYFLIPCFSSLVMLWNFTIWGAACVLSLVFFGIEEATPRFYVRFS